MRRLSDDSLPLDVFIESIQLDPPTRVPGTAVFLTSGVNSVPHSLLHNLKHNKVLHERVVFLTIVARDIPYVAGRRTLRDQTAGRRRSFRSPRSTDSPKTPTCRACSNNAAAADSCSR